MNRRAGGGQWIAAVAHYVGTFDAAFFGIEPSHRLAFLRAGEFYRVEDGRITQARIILDLPDLMRRPGATRLVVSLGWKGFFPALQPTTACCRKPATVWRAWIWWRRCWRICTSMTPPRVGQRDKRAPMATGQMT
ncbi:ester cyclase [Roseobacter cerasinus]|uniref:ester cyclase n=1 Tax=Roseobacter cerasinus TaxID=2602289 RepID=UPI0034D74738